MRNVCFLSDELYTALICDLKKRAADFCNSDRSEEGVFYTFVFSDGSLKHFYSVGYSNSVEYVCNKPIAYVSYNTSMFKFKIDEYTKGWWIDEFYHACPDAVDRFNKFLSENDMYYGEAIDFLDWVSVQNESKEYKNQIEKHIQDIYISSIDFCELLRKNGIFPMCYDDTPYSMLNNARVELFGGERADADVPDKIPFDARIINIRIEEDRRTKNERILFDIYRY